jgi:histidine triad (HIT) family protein
MSTIFEKIISRQIPAHIIYEDDTYIAFLDIFPKQKGHVLLVTKHPYRWCIEVPHFGDYFERARIIGLAIQQALGASYISFQTFGSEAPHAHIHIVPYYQLDTESSVRYQASEQELSEVSDRIKEILAR